jgi:glutamyl-Q tRNA(Asp) synthetase
VRIEDLDATRAIPGMADKHLATLEHFGFEWDEPPSYQSRRLPYYAQALAQLERSGLLYDCSCSRSELGESERYPGLCRNGPLRPASETAKRVRVTAGAIEFIDRIQGLFRHDPAEIIGDFVVRRRDQIIAYQLAVVVDDALQGISHIVRGADLLDNTPRQIYLQRALSLPTPLYAHVPLLVERAGDKLAKARRSLAIDHLGPQAALLRVFALLGLEPIADFAAQPLENLWKWAFSHWAAVKVPKKLQLPAPDLAAA